MGGRRTAGTVSAPVRTEPSAAVHHAARRIEAVLEAQRDIRALAIRRSGTAGTLPDVDNLTADAARSGFDAESSEIAQAVAMGARAMARVDRQPRRRGAAITNDRKPRTYAERNRRLSVLFEALARHVQAECGCSERKAEQKAREEITRNAGLNLGRQFMRIIARERLNHPGRNWKQGHHASVTST